MEREELLGKLELVAPALSDNDMIPILTHLWFTGDEVMAYNDTIAISTACRTEFEGATPGQTMMRLLKASAAEKVELFVQDNILHMKASRSDVKLGYRPPSDFVFEMPDDGEGGEIKVDKELLHAIDTCTRSVSTSDTSSPDQLGITVKATKSKIWLFSSNGATMSQSSAKVKADFRSVILSGLFCREMLRLCKDQEAPASLWVLKGGALLSTDKTTLFGRLIFTSHPLPFEDTIDRYFGRKDAESMIEVPPELAGILERAMIMAENSAIDKSATSIRMDSKDDRMWFETKSDRGHIKDFMRVKHPPIETKFNPRLLRMGLDGFKKMVLSKDCAIFAGDDDDLFLVAAMGS